MDLEEILRLDEEGDSPDYRYRQPSAVGDVKIPENAPLGSNRRGPGGEKSRSPDLDQRRRKALAGFSGTEKQNEPIRSSGQSHDTRQGLARGP